MGVCVLCMPICTCTYEHSLSYMYIDNIYNLLPTLTVHVWCYKDIHKPKFISRKPCPKVWCEGFSKKNVCKSEITPFRNTMYSYLFDRKKMYAPLIITHNTKWWADEIMNATHTFYIHFHLITFVHCLDD